MAKTLDLSRIETFCADLEEALQDIFPQLRVFFIIHNNENKKDKIAATLREFSTHPILDRLATLLKFKAGQKTESSFVGLIESMEKKVFGFKSVTQYYAFLSINYDYYTAHDDAFLDIYRVTSDLLESIEKTVFLAKESPLPLHPQRKSTCTVCKTKLIGDIFAALQMVKAGVYDSPQRLAKRRCIETLTPQSSLSPELHSFPMALDVVYYALDNQILTGMLAHERTYPLLAQYLLAKKIAGSFDEENFSAWNLFANQCQIMGWQGYTASQILGAAINTSSDPLIKANGHMLAELTNLAPVEEDHLPIGYNPFVADEINQLRHERQIEEIFEMVLIHAIEAKSALPFYRVAKNQNGSLVKGKIFGWGAYALQASGKAFQTALIRGTPPEQSARLEFQSSKLETPWKTLRLLGDHLIGLYRTGKVVQQTNILDYCKDITDAKAIIDSLEFSTPADDGTYPNTPLSHPLPSAKLLGLDKMDFLNEDS